ncbi:MAG: hypothetical protein IKL10_06760 [Clostridia bacterium]|nr:hypothetical protein [Clostridia bacterium]
MKHKKSREEYLELCADILCKSVYKMCRENYSLRDGKEKYDPKSLKETCSAVKEAAAVVSGLEKKQNSENESIRIVFADTEKYTE